ncbi:MAG: glycosyltransferase family 4 protein [Bacteroidales bacterium]|nr:glycosyltransferase family 4 protein [Bacteroidales bacterium]
MKIAVNTRLLLKDKLEGIGWFTYESMKRIVLNHPEHTFYFIFDRKHDPQFIFAENVIPVEIFPPARHPYLWYIYFEFSIPRILRKLKPDLFLSTDGWLSLRTNVPQVDVIHDLNFEHRKDFLKSKYQNYYTRFFPKFARKAVRIATVSEFSKQDLQRFYSIPKEKIDVVYNGSNAVYQPLTEDKQQRVRQKYANGLPYFLFVSAIHKRKNLANILRAFEQYKAQTGADTQFVVVGARAGKQDELDEVLRSMTFAQDVRFLGRLSAEELSQVMASALALVYATLFEGFGIPIVEAFNAETAVITSNVTSMPEVAGDAALLVDPTSVDQIADAMTQLATNENLRQELIAKGRAQRTKFSWELTAERLWDCVMRAYNSL